MPGQADLKDKPDDVAALVLALRSFATKPSVRVVVTPQTAGAGARAYALDGDAAAVTLTDLPVGATHVAVFRGANPKAVCERDVVIDATTTTLSCAP